LCISELLVDRGFEWFLNGMIKRREGKAKDNNKSENGAGMQNDGRTNAKTGALLYEELSRPRLF
jgi:hypothetical protein